MNPEIVQTQSWCYKTIVVIKRQQQTTLANAATALRTKRESQLTEREMRFWHMFLSSDQH